MLGRREGEGGGLLGRRGEAAATGGPNRYKMRENLISIGDDFDIEDEHGRKVFHVDGKALRVRQTLNFQDMQKNDLAWIQEKMLRIKDTMQIERKGKPAVTIKKAIIAPLRDRFAMDVPGEGEIEIQGNILDHEYDFKRGGQKIAEVSKRWFRIADTYGVEIAPGQSDILILAATTCVDQMAH
jgi:uncharacterized protein YxjI